MSCGIQISEDCFGTTCDGKPVKKYCMKNSNGFCVQVISYGATIISLNVPTKCGPVDVVLGFDDMQGYEQKDNPYFGATIGRVTNRTKPNRFCLGGKSVTLTENMPCGHIHGGCKGFDKVVWDSFIEGDNVIMKYSSKNGEEGYPGNLCVKISYSITGDNNLCVTFTATTDQLTIVNMTNHSYFNLAGHDAGPDKLKQHELKIDADNYLKLADLVATGEYMPVDGTGYDFRCPRMICEAMQKICEDGYDISYCLKPPTADLKLAAAASYKQNGVTMEVYTTAPGLQLYSANQMSSIRGKKGACYQKQSAICLETQGYPNAVNIKSFPSIELNPGCEYRHQIIYKFKTQ